MPLDQNELEILAARYVLGKVEAFEIRDFVNGLLNEGVGDQDLIDLYIDQKEATKEDLYRRFKQVLENRVPLPSEGNAATDLAYRCAKRATLGRISFEHAVHVVSKIYCPFNWHGVALNFDDFRWIDLEVNSIELAEPLCTKLVADFEAGEMRRWIPKPPIIRKGLLGLLDRLHGSD